MRIEPLNKQDVFLKHHHSKSDQSALNFNLSNDDHVKSSSNIEHDPLFDSSQSQKKKRKRKKKLSEN